MDLERMREQGSSLLRRGGIPLCTAVGILLLGGAALGGLGPFLSGREAAKSGTWEWVLLIILGSLAFFGKALLRILSYRAPDFLTNLEQRVQGLEERLKTRFPRSARFMLPGVVWLLWSFGWAVAFHRTNPEWIATGVDWHDSFLCAYAFLFDDPPLYSLFRYPLYPGISATIAEVFSLDLGNTLVGLSRFVITFLVLPLALIGRTLYGRTTSVLGVAFLMTLTTYVFNSDTVTTYPLSAFLGVVALAALLESVRGGVTASLLAGISIAFYFANDCKALSGGLVLLGMGLISATFAPGSALKRLARVLLMTAPLVATYYWVHSLPARAITLEQQASAILVEQVPGTGASRQYEGKGYLFGHFDDWWTVPRTLLTIREAQTRPENAAEIARRRNNSYNRFVADYPGITVRMLALCALGLILPLFRRGLTLRQRLERAFQLICIGGYVASGYAIGEMDYQERYVLHVMIFLPMLAVGALQELLRLIEDHRAASSYVRAVVLSGVAGLALFWEGSAVSFGHDSAMFDPRLGGRQERDVLLWARQHMKPNDILLDTTWMMTATPLAGEFAVARIETAYPPGGAPYPGGMWRVTRPWPPKADGRRFALVGLISSAPVLVNDPTRRAPEIDPSTLEPETPLAAHIYHSERWKKVFSSQDGIALIYEDTAPEAPGWWNLPPRLRP